MAFAFCHRIVCPLDPITVSAALSETMRVISFGVVQIDLLAGFECHGCNRPLPVVVDLFLLLMMVLVLVHLVVSMMLIVG